jgi:hypothetical protein
MNNLNQGLALITLDKLKEYFHVPTKAVCLELGISNTELKKLMSDHHISFWPNSQVIITKFPVLFYNGFIYR